MVSLHSFVEDNMKEFENNYFAHTFELRSHIKGTHEGDVTRMRDYFDTGLQSIDHTVGNYNLSPNTPACIRLHTRINRGWCHGFKVTKVKEKVEEKQTEKQDGFILCCDFFSHSNNGRR